MATKKEIDKCKQNELRQTGPKCQLWLGPTFTLGRYSPKQGMIRLV